MEFFDLYGYDGSLYVEKTDDGVTILVTHFTLDGNKAMKDNLHVYTVDFKAKVVALGPDYDDFKKLMR